MKPRFTSFREMPVWQEAMAVAEKVFAATDKLPRKEDYGFTSQIRRAALSISANIAEAFGRNHTLPVASRRDLNGRPRCLIYISTRN